MNGHLWLSRFVPLHATSDFHNHVGVPWRVTWWQWRGRAYRKRGHPTGPRDLAIAARIGPCRCHDFETGKRVAAEVAR